MLLGVTGPAGGPRPLSVVLGLCPGCSSCMCSGTKGWADTCRAHASLESMCVWPVRLPNMQEKLHRLLPHDCQEDADPLVVLLLLGWLAPSVGTLLLPFGDQDVHPMELSGVAGERTGRSGFYF